jgi:GTP cyclohydrolase II
MLLNKKENILLNIERAANDLRKGFPVAITNGAENIVAASAETTSLEMLQKLSDFDIKLILTAHRFNFIKKTDNLKHIVTNMVSMDLNKSNYQDVAKICGLEYSDNINLPAYGPATKLDESALNLAKIAELIPSVITFEIPQSFDKKEFTQVTDEEISSYKDLISYELKEACRTDLILKNNIKATLIAYRPNIGGREHYAILIGNNSDVPMVRIHSSCFTGDLLDSLACDCRDQLHSAIDVMNKQDGGIILYMLQEGRGIGLINKLRAYTLKEKGFDTVDANEALGFDDDERLFLPAAKILQELKINNIKLLTNNPRKASGLEEYGIKVQECVSHIMQPNKYNENYLKTKSSRLGHKIDDNSFTT